MKNIFLSVFAIFLFISVSAQKHIATIYFKDGKSIKGLAKIEGKRIKFKTSKKAKKRWFTHNTVESIRIKDFGENIYHKFYYKKIGKSTDYVLLELYKRGNISIYLIPGGDYATFNVGMMFGVVGSAITMALKNSNTNVFLCKNNSDTVTYFSNNNKIFREEAANYFKDCPSLVEKIKTKKFKRKHLVKIVEYYNKKCN